MKRRLTGAIVALLLMTGCSAPPLEVVPDPEPAPPPVERPQSPLPGTEPPGAPSVATAHGGRLIQAVGADYLWHLGGSRIAVANEQGLWSLRPDGEDAAFLAQPAPNRMLIAPFEDGVLYLDRYPEAVLLFLARPGFEPLQIAQLAHPRTTLPGLPTWAALRGEQLLLALEGQRLHSIDLASGQTQLLGDEPIPVVSGDLQLSPTRPVLAYKLANRGDGLRLLNLETGTVLRPGSEAHLAPIAWSPVGDRWAVQAAEADSGLPIAVGADLLAGATHLDLGDLKGGLRHLLPPQELELVAGPWWSADGNWLALLTGSVTDPEADRFLWVVDLRDETWHDLGPLPEDAWVGGFAPAVLPGPAVAVHTPDSLHLWSVSGEAPLPVTQPWQADTEPLTLPGGSLLYLGPEEAPGLYLLPPEGPAQLLLDDPSPKGNLTVSQRQAALILYREGQHHDLLILPLPAGS